MTIPSIPTSTIVLLLLLKVAPPLADTWSDGVWINKLANFGKEWSYFNVSTYRAFLVATEECDESQYFNGSNWIIKTVNWQTFKAAGTNLSSVSKEELDEIINGRRVINHKDGDMSARCKKDYSQWALASLLPLVACLLFTLLVWWKEEKGWTKVFLLPVVIIGLYSQYKAVKIILIGLGKWPNRRMEDWQEEKGKFTRETVSIEPVCEALPSLLIQVILLSTEMNALVYGNRPNPLGDNPALFLTTFGLSALLAVIGLTHFLKDGPSPLISSSQGYLDGFISKDFALLFSTTFLWFTSKCLLLSEVIVSRDLPSIPGFKLFNNIPEAMISWAATILLPQLLHAIIVLATSTGWNIFSLILSFPSFIITPLFTPFTYKGSCSDGKYEFRISIKHTIVNILLTFLLSPLTMVLYYNEKIWEYTYSFGHTPQQISYYQSRIKSFQEDNDTIAVNKIKDHFDLYTKYYQLSAMMFVILPSILLVLSLLPTCPLLRNCFCSCSCFCFGKNCSCFCGNTRQGKHRSNMKFQKIGRLRWQVKSEKDDTMERMAVHGGDLENQQATEQLEDKLDSQEDSTEQIKELIDQLISESILLANK